MSDQQPSKGDLVTDGFGFIYRVIDPAFDRTRAGVIAMAESLIGGERYRIPVSDLVVVTGQDHLKEEARDG